MPRPMPAPCASKRRRGRDRNRWTLSIPLVDALIAACAVGLSATLYTFNDKHYRVVPGLVTAQPYTR